ncbi:MAG: SH3 domain-containing protein [Oligoflexia bacterium]|nr:SH3 domain-containing protein [Oligoflexia bacterium]
MSRSLYQIIRCTPLALAVLAGTVQVVFAQDDMSVEQIRRELREAAATAAAQKVDAAPVGDNSEKESFTFPATEDGATNDKLVAAEAELLKKLESQQGSQKIEVPSTQQVEKADSVVTAAKSNHSTAIETVVKEVPAVVENSGRAALNIQPTKKDAAEEAPVPQPAVAANSLRDVAPVRSSRGEEPKEIVLRQQIQEIATLRKANSDLSRRAEKAEAKLLALQKQLSEAQNRLMLSETEVERLSSVIDNRNRATTNKLSGVAASTAAATTVTRTVVQTRAPSAPDMPVITVIADKANLRTGPGAENSPLMAVSKGTRLVVEKREGEWYRVVTPSGTRAWVSAEVVAFGPDALDGPRGALRIKGYDSSLENSPFVTSQPRGE